MASKITVAYQSEMSITKPLATVPDFTAFVASYCGRETIFFKSIYSCIEIGEESPQGGRNAWSWAAESSVRTPPAIEFGHRLAGYAPGDLKHVFFTTGGSTAVDSALRFVQFYFNFTGRPAKKDKAERKTRPSPGDGTDKFGSRLGSDRAKLNACLSKKPKSLKKLVEEAGLASLFFRKHLKGLVEKGLVKQMDDGFALA